MFPSTYGVVPVTHDYVKFHQEIIQPTTDIYPLYEVTGVESSTTGDVTFYKVKIESSKNMTIDIENQVSDIYVFHDFTKKIYPLNDSIILNNLIINSVVVLKRLKEYFFDEKIGMFVERRNA